MMKLFLPTLLASLLLAPRTFAQGEPPPPPPPVGEAIPPPPPPPPAATPAAPTPAPAPAPATAAAAPTEQYAYPAPPPAAEDTTVHNHDSFYLRLALGFGGMVMDRDGSGENAVTGGAFNGKSKIQGGGSASELSIGGTIASGFVLCGTLYTQTVFDAKLEPESGSDVGLGGNLNFLLLGIGVDWFPDPKGGFHFGGTLGVAAAVAQTPDNSLFDNLGGAGGALSLEVGYDFWIADQWSLGPMLRITGASLHGEDSVGNVTAKEDDTIRAASLMFSGLFH